MDGEAEQEKRAEQIFADIQNIPITPFQGWDEVSRI